MRTLQQIQEDRQQNTDTEGRIQNLSLDRRLCVEERDTVISLLGMEPENGERYAAETGELISWLQERNGEARKVRA